MLPTDEEVCPAYFIHLSRPARLLYSSNLVSQVYHTLFSQRQTSIKFADFVPRFLCVCVYHVLTMNYYNADTSKQPQTDPQAKYSGQLIKYFTFSEGVFHT